MVRAASSRGRRHRQASNPPHADCTYTDDSPGYDHMDVEQLGCRGGTPGLRPVLSSPTVTL